MKSEKNKDLEDYMSGKDPEKVTRALVKLRLDKDLKQRLSEKLYEKHGIRKSKSSKIKYLWGLLVFVLGALVVSYFVFSEKDTVSHYESLAEEYLIEPYDLNALVIRGQDDSSTVSILRKEAGQAYAEELYQRTAEKFSQIEQLSAADEEDYFYMGLAYLYMEPTKSKEAASYFKKALNLHSTYEQESSWYLSLSLLQSGEIGEAKKYLYMIAKEDPEHYRAKEAAKLIEMLNE